MYYSHSIKCRVRSYCILICISLVEQVVEYLYYTFLAFVLLFR